MSPTRYLPVISGSTSSRPVTAARRWATSPTVMLWPLPTLRIAPAASSRQRAGVRDIVDADEVAPLLAVLVDQRRAVVEQAAGEDRQHARVRVRQRLVRAVGVEEAHGHGRDPVGRPEQQALALLVELVQR